MGWSRQFPQLLTLTQGDSLPLLYTQQCDGSGASLTSLDGYHIRWSLRDSPDADSVRLSKSTVEGSITRLGRSAWWRVLPEETSALPVGQELYWDIQLTTPAGDVVTTKKGRLLLTPQISRITP
jgi:hypothetical protein